MIQDKKVIFSGIQPSGNLSIANYIGAVKNWTTLQEEYNCLYCVVDMHAITVKQDPVKLRSKIKELLMLYIACGLDPEKNIIYVQSHVPAHAELGWILNCYTYMGEMGRMTQYKEKSQKYQNNINVGLFDYPVLMAADILLYQTDLVPVGEDQKQHLEITRDIGQRFNNMYGDVFKIPEVYIPKIGARIMGLQDPTKKMSKSAENENDSIALLDSPDIIMKKMKKAVTDSDGIIAYQEDKPGVKNLLDIYCSLTEKTTEEAANYFSGKGYGVLKSEIGEVIVETLKPVQEKYKELEQNKDYLEKLMKENAEKANKIAQRTLTKVKKKIGFVL